MPSNDFYLDLWFNFNLSKWNRNIFSIMDANKIRTHECGAETGLEFVELGAIDDAGDDLAHIKGLARVGRDHAIQLLGIVFGRHRRVGGDVGRLVRVQVLDRLAREREGMEVVLRQVVGHA